MILAKRRYMDELAIREATRAADVTFVISVNDKNGNLELNLEQVFIFIFRQRIRRNKRQSTFIRRSDNRK